MRKPEQGRAGLRVLRFLAKGDARLQAAAAPGHVLLDGGGRGTLGAERSLIGRMKDVSLVAEARGALRLTAAGRAALEAAAVVAAALEAVPQERDDAVIETGTGREAVTVNHAESPLALLHRRRGKDGRPFLDAREFRAGERLRADYARGRIAPRLGVNWGAVGSAGRGRGDAGGIAELTDAALGARRRVEAAIEAVGPELSGVLIDVCCFLKGLEQVEMERRWPARSAKVVLKTALGALARHYEPERPRVGAGSRPEILHWGSDDYRPTLRRTPAGRQGSG